MGLEGDSKRVPPASEADPDPALWPLGVSPMVAALGLSLGVYFAWGSDLLAHYAPHLVAAILLVSVLPRVLARAKFGRPELVALESDPLEHATVRQLDSRLDLAP